MMHPTTCVVISLLYTAASTVAATLTPSAEAAIAPTQPSPEQPAAVQPTPELVQALKSIVNDFLGSPQSPLTRRLIAAKVSSGCTVGLMKLLRDFRNMEPWAYRLLDASGKYPTGLFQGTLSDVGAFDECIETVVRDYYGRETTRAQYCNVYLDGNATEVLRYLAPAIIMSHPRAIDFALESGKNRFVEGVRIGLCFITDCNQNDIRSLLQSRFLVKVLTAFSLRLNLEALLVGVRDKDSDAYMFRFFHGLRFFSMFLIVIGHSYNIFDFINTSRLVNALHYADNISFSLVMTGYLSVDVFFFLSGFLLAYNIEPKRDNILLTGLIAIVRRHISILLDTLNYVYILPFYHGMCYFAGCVTYFLLKKYGQVKISQMKQIGMWCLTLACALATVFLKYDWNRGHGPRGELIKIPLVFIDRLMWSFCISWTVFACSTRRGGVLWNFLSWKAFVPLSRLCFGIYIVHVPLFFIKSNIARERIFYSHFTLVLQTFAVFVASSLLSLTIYLACEAPVGRLEKMFLMPNRKEEKARRNCRGEQINIMRNLPCTIKDTELVNTKEQKANSKEYSSRL
ncbi:hypothetical protein MRX96_030027 [Rhipicephalus microplus]